MFMIMETRKMSTNELTTEIGKCCKQIEELGMNHKEACELVSTIMNLGIKKKKKTVKITT